MKHKRVEILLLAIFGIVLFISGCSKEGTNTTNQSSSKNVTLKVKNAQVMVADDGNDKENLIAVKVKVTNNAKDDLEYSQTDFRLKDGQGNVKSGIDTPFFGDADGSINAIDMGQLSNGESQTGYVFFKAKQGPKYTVTFKGTLDNDNSDDVKISQGLNTKVVIDRSDSSLKAAKAYIQGVFFGDQPDDYDDIVENNVIKESATFNKELASNISKRGFFNNEFSDEEDDSLVKAYQTANTKKTRIKPTLKYLTGNTAVVNISGYTLSLSDVYDTYDDKYDSVENVDNKTVIDRVTDIFSSEKPAKIKNSDVDLVLKRHGDKWKIETSSNQYDEVVDTFAGTGF
ncbi:DUF5105 domain-containing protein [Companilactobacillus mishanensis]|uniref:DUF5105 domain-containing protein n=1 Tax=Companilactobacillus mishanensis TaxID=2486008 RepID=A0A5P0ZKL2_9LACO|nr:DUF5105 domain-containing protein [Companilactobacillus mishanensis]MQS53614.1 DUF5105 domain-containing protein [Companilactobacillus mishanensis]